VGINHSDTDRRTALERVGTGGAEIVRVHIDSPAERLRLRVGDVIQAVEDVEHPQGHAGVLVVEPPEHVLARLGDGDLFRALR